MVLSKRADSAIRTVDSWRGPADSVVRCDRRDERDRLRGCHMRLSERL